MVNIEDLISSAKNKVRRVSSRYDRDQNMPGFQLQRGGLGNNISRSLLNNQPLQRFAQAGIRTGNQINRDPQQFNIFSSALRGRSNAPEPIKQFAGQGLQSASFGLLKNKVPEPTTTSGKVGKFAGQVVGSIPAFATGTKLLGGTTRNIGNLGRVGRTALDLGVGATSMALTTPGSLKQRSETFKRDIKDPFSIAMSLALPFGATAINQQQKKAAVKKVAETLKNEVFDLPKIDLSEKPKWNMRVKSVYRDLDEPLFDLRKGSKINTQEASLVGRIKGEVDQIGEVAKSDIQDVMALFKKKITGVKHDRFTPESAVEELWQHSKAMQQSFASDVDVPKLKVKPTIPEAQIAKTPQLQPASPQGALRVSPESLVQNQKVSSKGIISDVKIGGTGKVDEAGLLSSEMAGQTRDVYSKDQIKDFNRIKQMVKGDFTGDIDTLRKKNPKLIERSIESVRESRPDIINEADALDSIINFPTRVDTIPPKPSFGKGDQAFIAEATPKTRQKIENRNLKAEAKTANQDFNEWNKEVLRGTKKPTANYRATELSKSIKQATVSPAAKGTENLKDLPGFKAYTRDVYRNFKDVYGKGFETAKRTVLDPFDKSKGKLATSLQGWSDEIDSKIVKGLGIKKGSKESAAVQSFGEGNLTEPQLISQFGDAKAKKIVDADKWFRQQYDTLLDEVNAVTKRIYPTSPEKIIPRRSDYYRHFREMEGVKGLLNIFDSPSNIGSGLAGNSEFTLPKSKWLSFAQQRTGNKTDIDAVGGFLDYVRGAEYRKNIDPHIRNFQGLADEIDLGPSGEKLQGFTEYLRDYSRDLSGKTNPADRFVQKVIGRKAMSAVSWLNNRVKANVILGNASSSIAQIFNVPQGLASSGKHSVKGIGRTISTIFDKGTEIKNSDFIRERYVGDVFNKFDTSMLDKTKNFSAWMIGALDEVGTKYIWNSHYEKAIAEGINNPIKYADDITRSLVAGRGIGEVPLLQKSKMMQVIAPFQLEVANLWHVLGDNVSEKEFGKIASFAVASFVFNKGAKAIRGSDVSFDPINASMEAYNAFKEEEDKGIGALKAGGRLAGEVLSNVPLGQTAAAIYPEYGGTVGETKLPTRSDLFGEGDPTRFGSGLLAAKGLQDPVFKVLPPFGGQQIKRTLDAAKAQARGFSESKAGRVRFRVDPSIKGLIFGQYSSKKAREYFDNNQTPLGEKQSEQYIQIQEKQGKDQAEKYLESIIGKRKISSKIASAKKKAQEGEVSSIDGIYFNMDGNTVDVGKVANMPEKTGYDRVKKQEATFKIVDDVLKLPIDQQREAFEKLGVSEYQAKYYEVASGSVEAKTAYVVDDLERMMNAGSTRDDILKSILKMREDVNGKQVASDSVLKALYDQNIISKADYDNLRKVKLLDGQIKLKTSGRAKKIPVQKRKKIKTQVARPKKVNIKRIVL